MSEMPKRGTSHPDYPFEDGPPKRGISDIIALGLVTLDLDVVHRSTLKALCPSRDGEVTQTGKPANRSASTAFRSSLKNFEHRGWIRRDGVFVHALDKAALRDWVNDGVDTSEERAHSLLSVDTAVLQINADLESGAAVSGWTAAQIRHDAEIRRQELLALKRLMESGPGASHSGGTRSVRVIPRGGVL